MKLLSGHYRRPNTGGRRNYFRSLNIFVIMYFFASHDLRINYIRAELSCKRCFLLHCELIQCNLVEGAKVCKTEPNLP